MTPFELSGDHWRELLDGKMFTSVYCILRGRISFAPSKQHKAAIIDSLATHLVTTIQNIRGPVAEGRPRKIDASVILGDVLAVYFDPFEKYSINDLIAIYDTVLNFCEAQVLVLELAEIEPRENLGDVKAQISTLSTILENSKPEGGTTFGIQYLASSIYHGVRDMKLGTPPRLPDRFDSYTVEMWLEMVKELVAAHERTFREAL